MSLAPEYVNAGIYDSNKNLINGWEERHFRDPEGRTLCAFQRGEDGPYLCQIMQLPKFKELEYCDCIIAVGQSVVNGTEYQYSPDGQNIQTILDA